MIESVYPHTVCLLQALNKGEKPAIIADKILVKELNMGTLVRWTSLRSKRELSWRRAQPPDLEILEIGDLTKDRFRGIFRLSYTGDAHIELSTNVQVSSFGLL